MWYCVWLVCVRHLCDGEPLSAASQVSVALIHNGKAPAVTSCRSHTRCLPRVLQPAFPWNIARGFAGPRIQWIRCGSPAQCVGVLWWTWSFSHSLMSSCSVPSPCSLLGTCQAEKGSSAVLHRLFHIAGGSCSLYLI